MTSGRTVAGVSLMGISVFGLIGGLAYIGAFGTIGNPIPPGEEICSVRITLSGTVNDIGFNSHSVDDLNMNSQVFNCHEKGIFEFTAIDVSMFALLQPGWVNIYEDIVADDGQGWGSHYFRVDTAIGEIQKQFTEVKVFTSIPHGSYKLEVDDDWHTDSQPRKTFDFTV